MEYLDWGNPERIHVEVKGDFLISMMESEKNIVTMVITVNETGKEVFRQKMDRHFQEEFVPLLLEMSELLSEK